MSGRELYKIMIKNDLDFVIDKIIEKNNDLTIKELKIEKLEKEIDRLNNIIDEADTKNLELIKKINKIYDVIENKNITGIEARLLIQDILDNEE